jgi:hypothetical protein
MQQKSTNLWKGQRLNILLLVLMILLIVITIYLSYRWKQTLDARYPGMGLNTPCRHENLQCIDGLLPENEYIHNQNS